MLRKVERVCDGFSKVKYDLESAFNSEERELKIKKLNELIIAQKETLRQTRKTLRGYLLGIQKISQGRSMGAMAIFRSLSITALDLFVIQRLFLEREKLVYNTINKFKRQSGSLLLSFCWIPARDVNGVLLDLQQLKDNDPDNI
jgi:hypothetical protein